MTNEIINLQNNQNLITGPNVQINVNANVNNIVNWELNASFDAQEIQDMLEEALTKKIRKLQLINTDVIITEDGDDFFINGSKIIDEATVEVDWGIIDRQDFINTLKYQYIPEAQEGSGHSDAYLMEFDLALLEKYQDIYILSSNSTNDYLIPSEVKHIDRLNEVIKELTEFSS